MVFERALVLVKNIGSDRGWEVFPLDVPSIEVCNRGGRSGLEVKRDIMPASPFDEA